MNVQIILMIIGIIELIFILYVFKAENERKKKQSTVEYINNIRGIYKPIYKELVTKFPGQDRVINIEELDVSLRSDIKELLSIIEHLSVGINTGVYDFDIFFRMSGSYFASIYLKLSPYIRKAQRDLPTRYIEFEAICEKITIERKKRKMQMRVTYKGDIKYS